MAQVAVFFSAGLGNALLAQPLVKRLEQEGHAVTGIFTTDWGAFEAYDASTLLHNQVKLLRARELSRFGLARPKAFQTVFLDFFAATRRHLLLANPIGRRVISNRTPRDLPNFLRPLIQFQRPGMFLHEGTQYLRLLDRQARDEDRSEADFALPLRPDWKAASALPALPARYVAVQVAGGNHRAPYKTWPIERWAEMLQGLARHDPECGWVLLGDAHEAELGAYLEAQKIPSAINLVGKTSLPEAMTVLHGAQAYLGIDSGLMHLAVALGTRTFCLWGGSDHRLFGYAKVHAERHRILHQTVPCWPCNSYLAPNTSRVKDPLNCPDFRCIRSWSVEAVSAAFLDFLPRP